MGASQIIRKLNETCEECGGGIIVADGEHVCSRCGLVYERAIVHPRYVLNEEGNGDGFRLYVAPGERLHMVDGLGSYIDYPSSSYFKDASGIPLPPHMQRFYFNLKRLSDQRVRYYRHETDFRALCSLNRVVQLLKLPKRVRDQAAYLYRKVVRSGVSKKQSSSVILIAYCLLLAVREFEPDRLVTIRDITQAFRRVGHRVTIQSILHASLEYRASLNVRLTLRKSENYLPIVLDKVVACPQVNRNLLRSGEYPQRYRQRLFDISQKLLKKIDGITRGGRNPYIFAVSTVYAADRILSRHDQKPQFLTQRLLAQATGVAEYSIREHFSTLLKNFV
jgi:transcription initiation factor TFIIIB Brf1 subunit/transcription initiation factor TFIIB